MDGFSFSKGFIVDIWELKKKLLAYHRLSCILRCDRIKDVFNSCTHYAASMAATFGCAPYGACASPDLLDAVQFLSSV
jgi:uncharacterized protein YciW